MQLPVIVVVRDGVVESITPSTKERCERDLIDTVANNISNYEEYTQADLDAIKAQGYEKFGHGSVCLTWVEVPEQKA